MSVKKLTDELYARLGERGYQCRIVSVQHLDDLKREIESRQVEKMAQETGRVISQLRKISPTGGKESIYDEIANELEKLEGAEMAGLFKQLIDRMGESESAGKEAADHKQSKQLSVEPSITPTLQSANIPMVKTIELTPSSDEKIDIEKKAVGKVAVSRPEDDFEKYEKKLMEKYKK